jgi:hypothetical protein
MNIHLIIFTITDLFATCFVLLNRLQAIQLFCAFILSSIIFLFLTGLSFLCPIYAFPSSLSIKKISVFPVFSSLLLFLSVVVFLSLCQGRHPHHHHHHHPSRKNKRKPFPDWKRIFLSPYYFNSPLFYYISPSNKQRAKKRYRNMHTSIIFIHESV